MPVLNRETLIPVGVAVAIVAACIAGVVTILTWRENDRTAMQQYNTATMLSLQGIDKKVDGLSHRLDLFEQRVDFGTTNRITNDQFRLWLFKAQQALPDLPDFE